VTRLGNYWMMRTIVGSTAVALLMALMGISAPPARAAKEVTITGGGWGHGIGMSQYGAFGMAKAGKSATEILEHYYSGAKVETRSMPKVRVGLMQGRQEILATTSALATDGGSTLIKTASGVVVAEGAVGDNWRVEPTDKGEIRLFRNGKKIQLNGDPAVGDISNPLKMIFQPYNSLASIEGKSHDYAYGKLLFGSYECDAGFCLRLVLSLSMQKYLYGLGEVPASWPGAALRAQAIAGRTYAYSKIKRLGQHLAPCDCAVYDSTADQAYIGDSKRTGSGEYWDEWKAAVDDSDKQLILYEGEPIQAYYSSSSGGHTENNENVWGGTPIPYLRGVPDPTDNVSANPNYSWTVTMTWKEFTAKLNTAFGTGTLQKFKLVPPFGVSGRVTVVKSEKQGGVKIVGQNKTVRTDGTDIRLALGLKDTLFRVKVTAK
jgi:stage II sporulation protein D